MNNQLKKIICIVLSISFLLQQAGYAQVAGEMNVAAFLSAAKGANVSDKFRPLHLRYLSLDPVKNNFRLMLDRGDNKQLKKEEIAQSSKELLNYFLIGVSLPEDKFWVNLRPDQQGTIIDPVLEFTDIGKIYLEADLQLKKDTAAMTSPATPAGRRYWDALYKKADELFGQQNITIPTITRPWIVPGDIVIREAPDNAYIYKATLKVMLEEDYLKDSAQYNFSDPRLKALNIFASDWVRKNIIPQLTREINTSKRYAALRQVYYSLILAKWFKMRYRGTNNKYAQLIDSGKLDGLGSKTAWTKDSYYKAYQQSFNDGEYNIQEPVMTPFGQVIRRYTSGGIAPLTEMRCEMPLRGIVASALPAGGNFVEVGGDGAPVSSGEIIAAEISGDGSAVIQPMEFPARTPRLGESRGEGIGAKPPTLILPQNEEKYKHLSPIKRGWVAAVKETFQSLIGLWSFVPQHGYNQSAADLLARNRGYRAMKIATLGTIVLTVPILAVTTSWAYPIVFTAALASGVGANIISHGTYNTLAALYGFAVLKAATLEDPFIIPQGLQFLSIAQIGGEKDKEFWADGQGNLWIFKNNPYSKEGYRPLGTQLYNRFLQVVLQRPVEAYEVTLPDGRVGTLERALLKGGAQELDWRMVSPGQVNTVFRANALSNFRKQFGNVASLSKEQLQSLGEQVLEEMVVDWLFSNHDTHMANFLVDDQGNVVGIDKEQVFKYFPNDVLSLKYLPNGAGEAYTSLYYYLLVALASQGLLNDTLIDKVCKKIDSISDGQLREFMHPFAAAYVAAHPDRFANEQAFIEAFLTRKANLRNDFKTFFLSIQANSVFAANTSKMITISTDFIKQMPLGNKMFKKIALTATTLCTVVFNKQVELNRRLQNMYEIGAGVVSQIKNAGSEGQRHEMIISEIEREFQDLVQGATIEEADALRQEKELLVAQIRAPPSSVQRLKKTLVLLSAWIKLLRSEKGDYHRLYLARDGGYFHLIDKAIAEAEGMNPEYDAGSSVYMLSRARMSGKAGWQVYETMKTIIAQAQQDSGQDIKSFIRRLRQEFQEQYSQDANFRYIVDKTREELIELGYTDMKKLVIIDTGFIGTIPFFIKCVLEQGKNEEDLFDESGEELISLAIVAPSSISDFAKQLFGFDLEMFSDEERAFLSRVAPQGGGSLGLELEGINDHPIEFDDNSWSIQEQGLVSKLKVFFTKMVALQALLAMLEQATEIERITGNPLLGRAMFISLMKSDFSDLIHSYYPKSEAVFKSFNWGSKETISSQILESMENLGSYQSEAMIKKQNAFVAFTNVLLPTAMTINPATNIAITTQYLAVPILVRIVLWFKNIRDRIFAAFTHLVPAPNFLGDFLSLSAREGLSMSMPASNNAKAFVFGGKQSPIIFKPGKNRRVDIIVTRGFFLMQYLALASQGVKNPEKVLAAFFELVIAYARGHDVIAARQAMEVRCMTLGVDSREVVRFMKALANEMLLVRSDDLVDGEKIKKGIEVFDVGVFIPNNSGHTIQGSARAGEDIDQKSGAYNEDLATFDASQGSDAVFTVADGIMPEISQSLDTAVSALQTGGGTITVGGVAITVQETTLSQGDEASAWYENGKGVISINTDALRVRLEAAGLSKEDIAIVLKLVLAHELAEVVSRHHGLSTADSHQAAMVVEGLCAQQLGVNAKIKRAAWQAREETLGMRLPADAIIYDDIVRFIQNTENPWLVYADMLKLSLRDRYYGKFTADYLIFEAERVARSYFHRVTGAPLKRMGSMSDEIAAAAQGKTTEEIVKLLRGLQEELEKEFSQYVYVEIPLQTEEGEAENAALPAITFDDIRALNKAARQKDSDGIPQTEILSFDRLSGYLFDDEGVPLMHTAPHQFATMLLRVRQGETAADTIKRICGNAWGMEQNDTTLQQKLAHVVSQYIFIPYLPAAAVSIADPGQFGSGEFKKQFGAAEMMQRIVKESLELSGVVQPEQVTGRPHDEGTPLHGVRQGQLLHQRQNAILGVINTGAQRQALQGLQRFIEEREIKTRGEQGAKLYAEKAVEPLMRQQRLYLERDHLFAVLSYLMTVRDMGKVTFFVRGPPDTFYCVTATGYGWQMFIIHQAIIATDYNDASVPPEISLFRKFEKVMKASGRQTLGEEKNRFGFKVINDSFGRSAGDQLVNMDAIFLWEALRGMSEEDLLDSQKILQMLAQAANPINSIVQDNGFHFEVAFEATEINSHDGLVFPTSILDRAEELAESRAAGAEQSGSHRVKRAQQNTSPEIQARINEEKMLAQAHRRYRAFEELAQTHVKFMPAIARHLREIADLSARESSIEKLARIYMRSLRAGKTIKDCEADVLKEAEGLFAADRKTAGGVQHREEPGRATQDLEQGEGFWDVAQETPAARAGRLPGIFTKAFNKMANIVLVGKLRAELKRAIPGKEYALLRNELAKNIARAGNVRKSLRENAASGYGEFIRFLSVKDSGFYHSDIEEFMRLLVNRADQAEIEASTKTLIGQLRELGVRPFSVRIAIRAALSQQNPLALLHAFSRLAAELEKFRDASGNFDFFRNPEQLIGAVVRTEDPVHVCDRLIQTGITGKVLDFSSALIDRGIDRVAWIEEITAYFISTPDPLDGMRRFLPQKGQAGPVDLYANLIRLLARVGVTSDMREQKWIARVRTFLRNDPYAEKMPEFITFLMADENQTISLEKIKLIEYLDMLNIISEKGDILDGIMQWCGKLPREKELASLRGLNNILSAQAMKESDEASDWRILFDSYIPEFGFFANGTIIFLHRSLSKGVPVSSELLAEFNLPGIGVTETGPEGIAQLKKILETLRMDIFEKKDIPEASVDHPVIGPLTGAITGFLTAIWGHGSARGKNLLDFVREFHETVSRQDGSGGVKIDADVLATESDFPVAFLGPKTFSPDAGKAFAWYRGVIDYVLSLDQQNPFEGLRLRVRGILADLRDQAMAGLEQAPHQKARTSLEDKIRLLNNGLSAVVNARSSLDLAMAIRSSGINLDKQRQLRELVIAALWVEILSVRPILRQQVAENDMKTLTARSINMILECAYDILPEHVLKDRVGTSDAKELTKIFLPKIFEDEVRKQIKAGETTPVHAFATRGILGEMAGDIGDACYTAVSGLMFYPSLVTAVLFTSGQGFERQFAGSVLILENYYRGEKVWILRAINPSADFLATHDADDFFAGILQYAQKLADAYNRLHPDSPVRYLLAPTGEEGALSNRPKIKDAVVKKAEDGFISLDKPENLNGYPIKDTCAILARLSMPLENNTSLSSDADEEKAAKAMLEHELRNLAGQPISWAEVVCDDLPPDLAVKGKAFLGELQDRVAAKKSRGDKNSEFDMEDIEVLFPLAAEFFADKEVREFLIEFFGSPEKCEDFLGQMQLSIGIARELLDNYHKGDTFGTKTKNAIDVNWLLEALIAYLNRSQGSSKVEREERIVSNTPVEGGVTVTGSWLGLWLLFDNLIRNAREATHNNAPIKVRLFVDGGSVVLEVEDKGAGIDISRWEEIFALGATSKVESGNDTSLRHGIGLRICKRIAESHGGKVYVQESKVGEGSIFRVELPLARPVVNAPTAISVLTKNADSGKPVAPVASSTEETSGSGSRADAREPMHASLADGVERVLDQDYRVRQKPFIFSNEENQEDALQELAQAPGRGTGVHVGFGSLLNLDIMVARQSQYGFIADVNDLEIAAWHALKRALVEVGEGPGARENFKKLFLKYIEETIYSPVGSAVPYAGYHADHLRDIEMLLEGTQPQTRWFATEEGFRYVQRMFLEGRIAIFRRDIRDFQGFGELSGLLADRNLRIDSLYTTNIFSWFTMSMVGQDSPEVRQRDFARTMVALSVRADTRTVYVDAAPGERIGGRRPLNLRVASFDRAVWEEKAGVGNQEGTGAGNSVPRVTPSADATGGIDMRALPVQVQPVPQALVGVGKQLSLQELDKEWAQIENMVNAGIIPSGVRVQEYAQSCRMSQDAAARMRKIGACVAEILKMEEDQVVATDEGISRVLVFLETGESASILKKA